MIVRDEKKLEAALATLPRNLLTAFATLCAYRIFHAASRELASYPLRREACTAGILAVSQASRGESIELSEGERLLADVMAAMPDESEIESSEEILVEDVAASTAYALRTWTTGKAEEAIWASRRVYEAVDRHVIRRYSLDTGTAEDERRILAHPLVQQELQRQWRDLDELMHLKASVAGASQVNTLFERATRDADTLFGEE